MKIDSGEPASVPTNRGGIGSGKDDVVGWTETPDLNTGPSSPTDGLFVGSQWRSGAERSRGR